MKFAYLLCFVLVSFTTQACLWDKDTIDDELQVRGTTSLYDLLVGQFPHHGENYYTYRIQELTAKEDLSKDELGDLAVAYIRTEQYANAKSILLSILEKHPKDYVTLSNLGVLSKKKKDYKSAIFYMEKALAIKPEGHMGIGDWYVKMLQWRAQNEKKEEVSYSFIASSTFFQGGKLKQSKYKRLKRLLQNDQTFGDGFLVMGDILQRMGHLNLAFISYHRALKEGYPKNKLILQKLRDISYTRHSKAARVLTKEKVNRLFLKAEDWLQKFQQVENSFVLENKLPSFHVVLTRMKQLKLQKYRPYKKSRTEFLTKDNP